MEVNVSEEWKMYWYKNHAGYDCLGNKQLNIMSDM